MKKKILTPLVTLKPTTLNIANKCRKEKKQQKYVNEYEKFYVRGISFSQTIFCFSIEEKSLILGWNIWI